MAFIVVKLDRTVFVPVQVDGFREVIVVAEVHRDEEPWRWRVRRTASKGEGRGRRSDGYVGTQAD
jgi:hypothetical protein